MKGLKFVGEARKVLLMSWASRFGILATIFGALAQFQDQLTFIQPFVSQHTFSLLSLACAIAVPLSRIVKQEALREATGAANSQPGATDGAQ